jgi:hypothetical protein
MRTCASATLTHLLRKGGAALQGLLSVTAAAELREVVALGGRGLLTVSHARTHFGRFLGTVYADAMDDDDRVRTNQSPSGLLARMLNTLGQASPFHAVREIRRPARVRLPQGPTQGMIGAPFSADVALRLSAGSGEAPQRGAPEPMWTGSDDGAWEGRAVVPLSRILRQTVGASFRKPPRALAIELTRAARRGSVYDGCVIPDMTLHHRGADGTVTKYSLQSFAARSGRDEASFHWVAIAPCPEVGRSATWQLFNDNHPRPPGVPDFAGLQEDQGWLHRALQNASFFLYETDDVASPHAKVRPGAGPGHARGRGAAPGAAKRPPTGDQSPAASQRRRRREQDDDDEL